MAEIEDSSLSNIVRPEEASGPATSSESGTDKALIPQQDPEAITSDDGGSALAFPVVALGASAGGLDAFTRVLQNLPGTTGMAFLLIQHLAPRHASQLSALLSRVASMPVSEVEHDTPVQPDHVYVIPPNTLMTISRGVLKLAPRLPSTGVPMPVDHFFRSLAKDQKAGAIAVVLSGTDSDGALGLQAIREEGGIAIAQSEDSAKFAGMPHNAAGAGRIDLILPPEEIARELVRIGQRLLSTTVQASMVETNADYNLNDQQVNAALKLLSDGIGVDFRGYKLPTIHRRLSRRMLLKHRAELSSYVADLRTDGHELRALYEDILINVTGFFRDPDAFLSLERLLPGLFMARAPSLPVRVWVPGCSTGEEVYSIAICLLEAISKLPVPVPLQLFGTDLNEKVLSFARTAIYQENQLASLPQERRQQFFVRVPTGYQIVKSVRELCVFARQNICVDPPFSRLDLISCRNLLIYLGSTLQRNAIATLHYALQPGGLLMLGRSEALRGFGDLFTAVDQQNKIFRRSVLGKPSRAMIGRGFAREGTPAVPSVTGHFEQGFHKLDFERAVERIVLREYSPPWVVVDERYEIVHASGDTSPFLQLPTGAPSFDLLKMARDHLRGPLRNLLTKVREENLAAQSGTVRELEGREIRRVSLQVRRVREELLGKPGFLVLFSSQGESAGQSSGREESPTHYGGDDAVETEALRDELRLTTQRLQAIVDERDAANQELTSANEEIQSSNEELQSKNEELETAKEELQSSNEELSTLNEELQTRNQELGQLSDDLTNLMSSTTIPILLLDRELRIRRITPITESVLGIRPSDLGRPVGDIRMQLSVDEVESLARSVLLTLTPRALELQDREGRWRELHVRPYRTADNRIAGVVIVFIDINQIRQTRAEATQAREFAESVIEAVQTPLLVLRADLRIRFANRAFYSEYGLGLPQVEDQPFLEIGGREWDLPGVRAALKEMFEAEDGTAELECESEFANLGRRTVCIYLRSVKPDGEKVLLVAVEDITERKEAARILLAKQEQLKSRVEAGAEALRESETALLQSRGELRELAASLLNAQESERRRISRDLHDDLSQKVAKLQFDIETLEQKIPFSDITDVKHALRGVRDQTGTLADDLRRVAHTLHPSSLEHLGLSIALRSYTEEFSRSTAIAVHFSSRDVPREIPMEIAICFYRIVQEALRNVAKHAPKTTVDVEIAKEQDDLKLFIRDDGPGFDPAALRASGGLGLVSMQERVRLVLGRFSVTSKPGQGVQIAIQVPLHPEMA